MNEKQTNGIIIKRWQFAVILIVIVAMIGGGIFFGLHWNEWFGDKQPVSRAESADIDPDAENWSGSLQSQGSESGEAQGIQIPGYPSIPLPAGEKEVQIVLLNPEGNPCYFTFELVLDATGETLYTSKQVPPGKAVTKLTLSKALEAGTYDATIKITTASLKDQSLMNGANVKTKLVVQ